MLKKIVVLTFIASGLLNAVDERAPRPLDQFGNQAIAGCLSCQQSPCGNVQAVRDELAECCASIENNFQATWTILDNLMVNVTATVDLSGVFTALGGCCSTIQNELQEISVEFAGIFTVITDIKNTLTACCERTENNFEQTWTIINNLTAEAEIDLSGIFTVITDLTDLFTRCDLCGIYTALSALESQIETAGTQLTTVFTSLEDLSDTVTDCCAQMIRDFQATWTIIQALDVNQTVTLDLSGVFTALGVCCVEISQNFDQTWTILLDLKNVVTQCDLCGLFTVLATVENEINQLQGDTSAVFTVIDEIELTVTACCLHIDDQFAQTWTILLDFVNTVTRCDLCGLYTILDRNFVSISDTFSIIQEIRATFTSCCEELLNTLTSLASGCSSTPITQAAVDAAGGQYVISNPGTYNLAEDIVSPGAGAPQSIIFINASDVTLNMCGKRVLGVLGNATSGIVVGPNLRSVTIKNGNIEAVQTVGLLVSGGVSDLMLDNVATVSCGLIGIFLFGQTGVTPNPISSSSILNCQATNCGWINPITRHPLSQLLGVETDSEHSESADLLVRTGLPSRFVLFQWSGIHLRNCNNITVRNSQFCSNVSQQILGGIFILCSNCVISDCLFNENLGDNAIGCALIVCTGNTLERCSALRNRADSTTGAAAGFSIQDSINTIIDDCVANDNSGSQVSGFLLSSNRATSLSGCVAALNRGDGEGFAFFQENGASVKNCQSLANTSTTLNVDMSGFHSFLGTNNHFEDCTAQETFADLVAAGYRFTGEQNSSILNCLAQETLSSFTCAYGIFIETEPTVPTLSTTNYIRGNNISTSSGAVGAFGILDDAINTSSNLVAGNFALRNGINFSVSYPSALLPVVSGSFSGGMPATGASGSFANISINS